jgi:hypothetical protein
MRLAYADPPYPGCAHHYRDQPDYAGEVDHVQLVDRLQQFDGWVMHTNATPATIALLAPLIAATEARWCVWVKGFAAFKANVSVAYAWEPVIIKAARKPVVTGRLVMRDWIECNITLERGLVGAKPAPVCWWAFELMGAAHDDQLDDLFPGTGAVTKAWETWRRQLVLPFNGTNAQ